MPKKLTYEELEQRVQELENKVLERSKAQSALLQSEAKYRNLVEQLPSAIYLAAIDELSTTLFISPQIREILGFKPDEWKRDRDIWLMHIHSDDRERVLAEVKASHKSGGPFFSEYRMITRDGRTIWIRDQAKIVLDDTGRSLFLQGLISDVTENKLTEEKLQKAYGQLESRVEERTVELINANKKLSEEIEIRKRAEQVLRETENRYRAFFQKGPDGVVILDTDTLQPIEFNDQACGQLGYTRIEFAELRLTDIETKETEEESRAHIQKVIDKGYQDFETLQRTKQGEIRNVHVTAQTIDIGGRNVYHCIWRDITERKRAKESLQKIQRRTVAILEGITDTFYSIDNHWRFTMVNPAAERAPLGRPAAELLGKVIWELYPNLMGTRIHQHYLDAAEKRKLEHYEAQSPLNGRWYEVFMQGWEEGVDVYMRDITGRKKAEAALHESAEKYRILFNTFPLGITVSDQSGKIVEANEMAAKLLGISRDEHLSRNIDSLGWQIIDPAGAPMKPDDFASVRALKENRLVENVEMGIVKPDGDTTWISVTASPLRLENYGVVVTYGDITDRKRAEREYRTLFQEMIDGFALHEIICNERGKPVDYRFLAVNPAFERQTQLKAQDIVGKTVLEVLPNTEPYWIENYGRVALTSESITFENYSQEFDRFFYVTAFSPAMNQFACIFTDITKRKRAEQSLMESEKKYRLLAENAMDVIWIRDLDLKLTYVSPSIEMLSGYTVEEALNKDFSEIITPDSASLAMQTFAEAMQNLKSDKDLSAEYSIDLEQICKDGRKIWMECKITPLKSDEGNVVGMLGVSRDITERKQIEASLRKSEEEYRKLYEKSEQEYELYHSILHTSADAIVFYDMEGWVKYINPSFSDIFGWTLEELQGRRVPFVPEMEKKVTQQVIQDIIEYGRPISGFHSKRYAKDGRIVSISISGSRYNDHEGNPAGMLVILRDTSQEKKLEAQLRRAQKMEALGLLAGGVAHDLNNILSGIVSYPELILMDLPQDSPLRKPIKTILQSGMRAAAVVADLLTIARGVAIGKETLNLNSIVNEYLGSAEFQALENVHALIRFKTELASDLLNTTGSPVHIKKTLMNLVTNASEAIDSGGKVTISTANRYLDKPLKGYEHVRTGEYAVLSITDNGSGISPEDIERIFEPFYTKKVMGRSGTGLGLAVVWNTVQDHKGYVDVRSNNMGTTFELYFPVTRDEIAEKTEPIGLEEYMGHGENILVVDDEESQREIATEILTKLGYHAVAVSGGEEAIEYVKEHAVDLIVLDMVMPKEMNGREAYEAIIKIRPGQKAIIASGYAKTEEVDTAQKLGAGKYIRKPYTLEKIGIAVKEELEK